MNLELLKHDCFPIEIENHEQFVAGLNDILRNSGIQSPNTRITTFKRIFYLEVI